MKKEKKDKKEHKDSVEKEAESQQEAQGKKTEEEEYNSLWDNHLRLQAEFDNYKKRSFKERSEFIKFANEGLILELLSILDNFERGIRSAELKKDFDLLHQGVDMISRQLHALLEAKGLKRIKSAGEKFDPHQHDAMEVIEDEEAKEERVIEEMQPGYTLNGRIIRPAKVKVVKKKEAEKQRCQEAESEEKEKEDKEKEEESKEEKGIDKIEK